MNKTFQDLTGQKFGTLTVVKFSHRKNNRTYWICKCDCGTIKTYRADFLKRKQPPSCGCIGKKKRIEHCRILGLNRRTHGKIKTRLYKIYHNMKDRCYRKSCKAYKYYGQRGITIYQGWLDNFENFYNWATTHGYADNLTIDRINNDGNYSPENCRWVDMKTQANNTRKNIKIAYNNKTQTLKEWADELGMTYTQLHHRYERGWELNRMMAITQL